MSYKKSTHKVMKKPAEVLYKKNSVLGNFTKFTEKHMHQSLFLDIATVLIPCFQNTSERLLLEVMKFVLNKLAS